MTRIFKNIKYLLVSLSLFSTSACAQVGVDIANFPANFGDIQRVSDISYGDDPAYILDIYQPAATNTEELKPVIVFFYGGRWTEGSKDQLRFVGKALAEQGYVTVLPNYRTWPDVKFPAFVEDGAKAVAWVTNNIEEYGGDAERLFISGHSAGAHIGALLTADEQYLNAVNVDPSLIKGFAGLAGPYDFVPEAEDLKKIFGPPENYPQMQVPTFIDGTEAPMYLLHGADDETVIQRNLNRLRDKIEEKGGKVKTKIYDDIDHIWIVGVMSWLGIGKPDVARDITDFFDDL